MHEAKPSWDATWLGTRSLRWYRQRTLASGWLAVNCPRSWIMLNLSDLRIWIAFNKEHKRFNKSMYCCYLFLDFLRSFNSFLSLHGIVDFSSAFGLTVTDIRLCLTWSLRLWIDDNTNAAQRIWSRGHRIILIYIYIYVYIYVLHICHNVRSERCLPAECLGCIGRRTSRILRLENSVMSGKPLVGDFGVSGRRIDGTTIFVKS